MKKYAIITLIASLLLITTYYLGVIKQVTFIGYFAYSIIIIHPIIHLICSIKDSVTKVYKFLIFIFIPFIILLFCLYLYDGMTTANTNPDSSNFLWMLLLSKYLFGLQLLFCLFSLFVLHVVKHKRT